ncbi:PcfJ domain-containing protein [Shewanella sp. 6_MG-2023]|uniref:PcfJ domain-containing protein n=1 Tax=Shewanella sp. 6_MG-2023 TaxID=3062660 RepID=UPI0026E32080|nr:PcfJ domain-containing protein [Shewanella sp. 6_MG-2023]MDO6620140.1 PcfJ domain-containing protein [Shewanella sp. 6_MG-2023]
MDLQLTIQTSDLGFDYDLELHSWQQKLQAFRVFGTKPKERLEGGLGLGLNLITQFSSGDEWLAQIPKQYLAVTNTFSEHEYQLLWLAANSQQAAQLLLMRPLLLVLICEQYPIDNDKALSLSHLGQRDILKELGYDNAKATLKFIDKFTLKFERDVELKFLKKLLDKTMCRYKVFKHHQTINYLTISLDNRYPFLTCTKLGHAIANDKSIKRGSLRACLADTIALGLALGINEPANRIGQLSSFDELEGLHQRWIDLRNDIDRLESRPVDADVQYPQFIASEPNFVAIDNYDALIHEGMTQKHCIAVYHNRIVSGHYFAFKMERPQRVTIGVKVNKRIGMLELDQISGIRNAIATNETREIVYMWFERVKKTYKQKFNPESE